MSALFVGFTLGLLILIILIVLVIVLGNIQPQPRPPPCPNCPSCTKLVIREGSSSNPTFRGTTPPLGHIITNTREQCEQKCLQKMGCTTYNFNNQQCTLYNDIPPLSNSSNGGSGIIMSTCSQLTNRRIAIFDGPNTSRTGFIIQSTPFIQTLEECSNLCINNENCASFVYFSSIQECTLNYAAPSVVFGSNLQSGIVATVNNVTEV